MGWKLALGLGGTAAVVPLVWATFGTEAMPRTAEWPPSSEGLLQTSIGLPLSEPAVTQPSFLSFQQVDERLPAPPAHAEILAAVQVDNVAEPETRDYAQAVRDLHDDAIWGNAKRAQVFLRDHLEEAYPAIEFALSSQDPQQRHLAASLVSQRSSNSAPLPPKVWAVMVDSLRDDHVWRNASNAQWFLGKHMEEASWELEPALRSEDHQQRQIAAELFGRLLERELPVPPALWPVMVEALVHDDLEAYPNAYTSTYRLARYGGPAVPLLRDALRSTSTQQRFLSASILAWRKDSESVARTTSILIEHLRSNTYIGDARVACSALWTLGPLALPYLREHRHGMDAQARYLVELCIQSIEDPAPTAAECLERVLLVPDQPLESNPFQPDTVGLVGALSFAD